MCTQPHEVCALVLSLPTGDTVFFSPSHSLFSFFPRSGFYLLRSPAGFPWQRAGESFYTCAEVTLEAQQEQSDSVNTLHYGCKGTSMSLTRSRFPRFFLGLGTDTRGHSLLSTRSTIKTQTATRDTVNLCVLSIKNNILIDKYFHKWIGTGLLLCNTNIFLPTTIVCSSVYTLPQVCVEVSKLLSFPPFSCGI